MAKITAPRSLKQPADTLALFTALEQYVLAIAQAGPPKGRHFSICLRASFAKCYDFNLFVWDEYNSSGAFFWLPMLRGICEDIIVLNYAQKIPPREREILFSRLMQHDIHTRLTTQEAFFSVTRPLQPVLKPWMTTSAVETLEDDIRSIWRAHGWPRMNRGVIPVIRQIAEKDRDEVLTKLYDYLYRLASHTVHFNVGALFRTGWGDKLGSRHTFSVKHFNDYYAACGRVYGAYMFCAYFELFARFLRPGKTIKPRIDDIRNSILSIIRWPEMVTFEEMNIPVPKPNILVNALSVVVSQESKKLLARSLTPQGFLGLTDEALGALLRGPTRDR